MTGRLVLVAEHVVLKDYDFDVAGCLVPIYVDMSGFDHAKVDEEFFAGGLRSAKRAR